MTVERRDLLLLVGAMLAGIVLGAIVGALAALATGYSWITVFGAVGGSYLGMVYADLHWGPRSRRVRAKRAEEARRKAAEAERVERTASAAAATRRPAARAARKAAARAKR